MGPKPIILSFVLALNPPRPFTDTLRTSASRMICTACHSFAVSGGRAPRPAPAAAGAGGFAAAAAAAANASARVGARLREAWDQVLRAAESGGAHARHSRTGSQRSTAGFLPLRAQKHV